MADTLVPITEGFWNLRGSFKLGGVLDIGTQASLVRLASGRFVLLDAYTLQGPILDQVWDLTDGGAAIDAVVNLHPFHTVHVKRVHGQLPHARWYGTARHHAKAPDVPWRDTLCEDPALSAQFDGEFRFSVPAGLDLVPDNPNVHTSSVLALHRPTRVLHVDDTLGFNKLPLVGGLAIHPALPKALSKRAGAAAAFRSWANGELLELCAQADHLCTAHMGALPPHQGSAAITAAVRAAVAKVEGAVAKHERRWG